MAASVRNRIRVSESKYPEWVRGIADIFSIKPRRVISVFGFVLAVLWCSATLRQNAELTGCAALKVLAMG